MSIEQWIFHYKVIIKNKNEESKVKIETIKAVVGESVEILKTLFERNAEMVGFFTNKEDYFKYIDKKKELEAKKEKDNTKESDGKRELTEEEALEADFELFMSDAFPDNIVVDSKLVVPDAAVLKKTKKRLVGIQRR